jgi:hypothetical protein
MIFPHRMKNRTTTREKLSRLRNSVWERRARGISRKITNPMVAVMNRLKKTGT